MIGSAHGGFGLEQKGSLQLIGFCEYGQSLGMHVYRLQDAAYANDYEALTATSA